MSLKARVEKLEQKQAGNSEPLPLSYFYGEESTEAERRMLRLDRERGRPPTLADFRWGTEGRP